MLELLAKLDELESLLALPTLEIAGELGVGLLIVVSEPSPAAPPPQPIKRRGITHVNRQAKRLPVLYI